MDSSIHFNCILAKIDLFISLVLFSHSQLLLLWYKLPFCPMFSDFHSFSDMTLHSFHGNCYRSNTEMTKTHSQCIVNEEKQILGGFFCLSFDFQCLKNLQWINKLVMSKINTDVVQKVYVLYVKSKQIYIHLQHNPYRYFQLDTMKKNILNLELDGRKANFS